MHCNPFCVQAAIALPEKVNYPHYITSRQVAVSLPPPSTQPQRNYQALERPHRAWLGQEIALPGFREAFPPRSSPRRTGGSSGLCNTRRGVSMHRCVRAGAGAGAGTDAIAAQLVSCQPSRTRGFEGLAARSESPYTTILHYTIPGMWMVTSICTTSAVRLLRDHGPPFPLPLRLPPSLFPPSPSSMPGAASTSTRGQW